MAYQSGRNIRVAYKAESAFGVLPGATDAQVFRINSGGLNLAKEPINSNELRADGMSTRGRHGSRSVTGSYVADLSVGTFDDLIEAVFRGTFSAALELDETDFTSITTTANTIVLASGSPSTLGLRIGEIIRLTDHATTGNNNRNLRITDLNATTITVAETLIVDAVADTAVTITRPKSLIQGVTPRSFTFEEYEADIDGTEIFTGCRVGSMQLQLQPNGMAMLTFGIVGQDMDALDDSSAPYFTSPTKTTTIGLTAVEAKIMLGGVDVLDVSSIDMTLQLNASGVPVVGSVLTPEVFTNSAQITLSVTALKKDIDRVQQYLNEDELSLHLLFEENETGAADFCAFYLPNITLASASKSELGQDNGRTTTFTALVGVDERGSGHPLTMIGFQTSAA
ncbi:phage tail tube protein [Devosia sp. Root635]|uniref:phage tail tube protein n=1 Tax=Devosia sp. Root635 TaxID=1736575 RepID=UPI0006F2E387|nr:phage tail tube protein [Devosia sp. Root635]KRA42094.1 hypothetical protein ASD80_10225 [Devosia sp. Root635]